MADPWTLGGSALIAAGAVIVGWFTLRTAKDTTKVNTLSAQTAELRRLAERVDALEDDRDHVRTQNREHVRWDRTLIRRLREALPDEDFPDPPPIDT